MNRALTAILSNPWAITTEALETIVAIAEREHEFAGGNLEALEKRLGRPLGNTEVAYTRDNVAVIPVEGPLFSKANLFTMISGATSYDVLARDFQAALDDPSVQSIVLKISSPGGAVEGTSQLAQMIYEARGTKPITAYISGQGASAAYWIASAADTIVAADTAIIGSIGVQSGMTVRDPKAGEKSYRFVSSQSPNKNASPDTKAGSDQMQQMVDHLAIVFIESLAEYRGITVEKVLADFGQGAVFVANEALNRGMIDKVSSFESMLNTLQQEIASMDYADLTAAALAEKRPDLVAEIRDSALASVTKPDLAAIRAEGVSAERARITELEALAVPGAEELVAKFKSDGTEPAVAALAIIKHMKANPAAALVSGDPRKKALEAIANTEAELTAPATVEGKDKPNDMIEAAMASAKAAGIAV